MAGTNPAKGILGCVEPDVNNRFWNQNIVAIDVINKIAYMAITGSADRAAWSAPTVE
jgi:hypothetical protein